MIRVAICDDDIVFTTRVEELILDFGRAYSFEICIYFDGYTLLESMRQGNCQTLKRSWRIPLFLLSGFISHI